MGLFVGLEKVNGKMNLIMFCYNFMRTKNILGFDRMMQQIKSWTPDYTKVVRAFKNAFLKAIYSPIKPFNFFEINSCIIFTLHFKEPQIVSNLIYAD